MKTIKCKVKFSETGSFGGRCDSCLPPNETVSGIISYIYIYIHTYTYTYTYTYVLSYYIVLYYGI